MSLLRDGAGGRDEGYLLLDMELEGIYRTICRMFDFALNERKPYAIITVAQAMLLTNISTRSRIPWNNHRHPFTFSANENGERVACQAIDLQLYTVA